MTISFTNACVALFFISTSVGCGVGQDTAADKSVRSESVKEEPPPLPSGPFVSDEGELQKHELPRWPQEDGYCDPNLIVYDASHLKQYLAYFAKGRMILCGGASRQMTINGRTVRFSTGLDDLQAGYRFNLKHLRQFLQKRIEGTIVPYSDVASLKELSKYGVITPYVQDVCICIDLIGSARATDAHPEIDALLSDRDQHVRTAAISTTANFGAAATASVPKLVELLETESASAVSNTLVAIGPAAVAALKKKVNSGGTDARIYAIDALGLIGPAAAPAVEELIAALYEKKDVRDRSGYISSYAAEALGHIGDRQALPHLKRMTAAKNHDVQFISKAAIREIEGGPRFQRH